METEGGAGDGLSLLVRFGEAFGRMGMERDGWEASCGLRNVATLYIGIGETAFEKGAKSRCRSWRKASGDSTPFAL